MTNGNLKKRASAPNSSALKEMEADGALDRWSRLRFGSPLTEWRTSTVTGLWLERTLMASPTNHTWIETPIHGGPYAPTGLLVKRLETLHGLVDPQMRRWLRLPDVAALRATEVYWYEALPRGPTLFEQLDIAGERPFALAGARLASFHNLPSDLKPAPPNRPILDLIPSIQVSQDLETLRSALAVSPAFARQVRQAEAAVASDPATLLHGRWSTAMIQVHGLRPANLELTALGGIDIWLGPAEYDLGYLIGELIEHVAGAETGQRRRAALAMLRRVRAMGAAYREERVFDATGVVAFAAHRIAAHLAANALLRRRLGHEPLSPRTVLLFFATAEQLFARLARCLQ